MIGPMEVQLTAPVKPSSRVPCVYLKGRALGGWARGRAWTISNLFPPWQCTKGCWVCSCMGFGGRGSAPFPLGFLGPAPFGEGSFAEIRLSLSPHRHQELSKVAKNVKNLYSI